MLPLTWSLWVRKGEVFFLVCLNTDILLKQQGQHWACGIVKLAETIRINDLLNQLNIGYVLGTSENTLVHLLTKVLMLQTG